MVEQEVTGRSDQIAQRFGPSFGPLSLALLIGLGACAPSDSASHSERTRLPDSAETARDPASLVIAAIERAFAQNSGQVETGRAFISRIPLRFHLTDPVPLTKEVGKATLRIDRPEANTAESFLEISVSSNLSFVPEKTIAIPVQDIVEVNNQGLYISR